MKLRILLLAASLVFGLGGCVSGPFPDLLYTPGPSNLHKAGAVVTAAREAHGATSFQALRDVNVGYDGDWSWLVTKLQPVLTDAGYRGRSQERLLPADSVVAQRHVGPKGVKQVLRTSQDIKVAYDGVPNSDAEVLDAAAMVADGYALFLLGPLVLDVAQSNLTYIGEESIDGRICDVVTAARSIGRSKGDKLVFWFDRETHLMRRVRFSLNGMVSTQGAVAEVEVADYVTRSGVQWPTLFVERLIRPVPGLTVHHWRLIGLDLNRGYGREAIGIDGFTGAAAADALILPTSVTR